MTSVGSFGDDIEDVAQEVEFFGVDNGNEFRIGMVFKSIEDAEACYRDYGLSNGFTIRKRSTYKTLRGSSITGVVFTCSCEGARKKKTCLDDDGYAQRNSSTMKSGCTARMRIKWIKRTNLWEISIFEDKHNHALVIPNKRIFQIANRRMNLTKENVQCSKIPSFFNAEVMRHVRSLYYEEGDVEGVKSYFTKMVALNPQFYYSIQYDASRKAANFFWVDGRSRVTYNRFGDTITFDTTYRKNKYNMPFAPFTGVNHHRQTIFFGCAMLENERENTFVWLFENWLEAMGGRPPISIITNHDLAIGGAIAKVFPKTRHRFCVSHIKKKLSENLPDVFFKKSKFKQAVKRCIRGACTGEEFEEKWGYLLQEYALENNEWLKHLYEIREYWIPVYCRDTFFAGMATSQCNDSINSFFDGFVTSKTNLREFVTQYDQTLESIYVAERKEDYISTYESRVLKTEDPLVAHAANTYTRNVFEKFAEEFAGTYRLGVDEKIVDGDIHTYVVRYKVGGNEEWVVKLNLSTKEGSCGCQLFDFFGIPCKHLMKVFDRLNYIEIPTYFIKKRWLKYANRTLTKALDDMHIGSRTARIKNLDTIATELAYMAAESEMGYQLMLEVLDKAYDQVKEFLLKKEFEEEFEKENSDASITVGHVAETCSSRVEGKLLDLDISQGRKRTNQGNEKEAGTSNVRISNGLEMSIQKKPRICRACRGHGHDSRNCKMFPRT